MLLAGIGGMADTVPAPAVQFPCLRPARQMSMLTPPRKVAPGIG